MVADPEPNMPCSLLVPSASTGEKPASSSAGMVISPPPPAIESTKPAAKAAKREHDDGLGGEVEHRMDGGIRTARRMRARSTTAARFAQGRFRATSVQARRAWTISCGATWFLVHALENWKGILMAIALLDQIRSIFDGDPGVRKVADDPVLVGGTADAVSHDPGRRVGQRERDGCLPAHLQGRLRHCGNQHRQRHRISQRVRLRDQRLAGDRAVPRPRRRAAQAARPPHGGDRQGGFATGRERGAAACAARSTCSTSARSMW